MKFEEFLTEKGISFSMKEGKVEFPQDMSAEELADVYNKYNETLRKAQNELIESKASKDDINNLREQLEELKTAQMDMLNQKLKEQGVLIKKLTEKEKESAKMTFGEQITKSLEDNLDSLKTMKSGGKTEATSAGFDFEVKVPITMNIFGAAPSVSGGNIPIEDRIEGLNIIPSRQIRVLDVMSKRSTTSNVVSWVYQANADGTTGQTQEGAAKNQIDFDLVVASEQVKKTTNYIKVTTEMLDDITWIQSEIQQELMRELMKAVEAQAYEGGGTGQNHNGIVNQASAFAAGAFAAAVDEANQVDVLAVAANQITVAQEGVKPNYIFMHPTDVTKLKLVKLSSTDKRYVERLMMVGSTLMMDGIPIIESTLVTVGDYLIGDFSKAILVDRSSVRIDIGLDGNDFTNNVRTILAEWRGLTLIKNNDTTAFVTGTFATDQAALETA